jgi:hypothetical protein
LPQSLRVMMGSWISLRRRVVHVVHQRANTGLALTFFTATHTLARTRSS